MEIYCGTDIIEVERIRKAILSNSKFKEKIFTESEILYAESKTDVTKYQHYAGRFAAKEAIYKSISATYPNIKLNEIEILNDTANYNRPIAIIHNKKIESLCQDMKIDVSISHIKDYACANAVVVIK